MCELGHLSQAVLWCVSRTSFFFRDYCWPCTISYDGCKNICHAFLPTVVCIVKLFVTELVWVVHEGVAFTHYLFVYKTHFKPYFCYVKWQYFPKCFTFFSMWLFSTFLLWWENLAIYLGLSQMETVVIFFHAMWHTRCWEGKTSQKCTCL